MQPTIQATQPSPLPTYLAEPEPSRQVVQNKCIRPRPRNRKRQCNGDFFLPLVFVPPPPPLLAGRVKVVLPRVHTYSRLSLFSQRWIAPIQSQDAFGCFYFFGEKASLHWLRAFWMWGS